MKLYADTGSRRTRQMVADLLFVLWVVGWVWFGVLVHDKTMALAGPGRDAESAGAGLADGLGDAGDLLDGVPLVGGEIEDTFEKAAGASTRLSEAGRQEVEAVEDLSVWLGVAVVAIPVLAAVPFHLPGRVRFVREASAMSRLLAVHYDRDLLALRALARLPLAEITSLGPDPADAWRRRDPRALDALAAAELRSTVCGLQARPAGRPSTTRRRAEEMTRTAARSELIVEVITDAFAPLMKADPVAFRGKFRKMSREPHAFYRGTACLFYADVTGHGGARRWAGDPYADERSGRIWIHGDLHVENFGTYLNSDGRLVFDVNDFDEAYIGRFTWDLQRFAASLALVGWQKALPDADVRSLVARFVRAYLAQVDRYRSTTGDEDFALHLDNTGGPVLDALHQARLRRRADFLDATTDVRGGSRRFLEDATVRRLPASERDAVRRAFEDYLETIPASKRFDRALFYELRDVVGKSGFGIGSAGLPAYNLLVEGYSQALDNDVVLSMKQANVPAVSRFVETGTVEEYFEHEAHRTVVSQRALQVHTDPLLGYTRLGGTGYVVSEVSPYELDLDWTSITEPDDLAAVVDLLGRATAKIHCASDEDSEQDLVDFQVEDAVAASVDRRRREFTDWVVDFGVAYAAQVRTDHALFVEAFREGRIGVSAT